MVLYVFNVINECQQEFASLSAAHSSIRSLLYCFLLLRLTEHYWFLLAGVHGLVSHRTANSVNSRARGRLVNLRELGCDLLKKLLDVVTSFGAHLFKNNVVLLSQLPTLSLGNISFSYIYFVGDKSNDNAVSSLILDILNPFWHALE